MPRFSVSYTRRILQDHHVVVEADSDSAVRQAWIDGDIPENVIEEDVLSESGPTIKAVADTTPVTPS